MRKRFLGIICLIYVALILYVKLTGNLGNYLAPQMQKYIIWSVVPLLIIGLVICLNNHISYKFKFTDIVLLLPIVMIIFAGDGRLTASLANNRNTLYKDASNKVTSSNEEKTDNKEETNTSQEEQTNEETSKEENNTEENNNEEIVTPEPKYDFSTVDYDVVDASYSMLTGILTYPDMNGYDINYFVGKKIRVRGFAVKKLQYMPTGYFSIGKYIISCCAADAGFGGFFAKYDLNKIKENTWYEVEGVFDKIKDNDGYNTLVINVINIKEIDGSKEEQYAYPCYSYDDGSCSALNNYDFGENKYDIQN